MSGPDGSDEAEPIGAAAEDSPRATPASAAATDAGHVTTPTAPPAPETVRDRVIADVRQDLIDDANAEAFPGTPDAEFLSEEFFDFSYLDDHDELQRYWVNRPFAYVSVVHDPDTNTHRYHVAEPDLDEFAEYVREDLLHALRSDLMYKDLDDERDRAAVFDEELRRVMAEHAATIDAGTLHQLRYYLRRDLVGYGKVDPVMRDRHVEDVSCDGADVPVFVYHNQYRDLRTNLTFGEERLSAYVVRLAQRAGKHLSVADPLVDASLPDGSRVQLTLGGEVTTRGSNFTIRKFAEVPFTPIDLIDFGTFSLDQMAYLWLAIELNASGLFAGGTGSGKTTSVNAASLFVPPDSKIVSIEDTPEITLPHENWVQSVTRDSIGGGQQGSIGTYELLRTALRQRPEYLVVGEIRTEQQVALTFFQAIATGHTAYTTFHADSVRGLLGRLGNEPLNVPREMIGNLDLVSIQQQVQIDGRRVRRNKRLVEIVRDESGSGAFRTHEVFRRDPKTDSFEQVADSAFLYRRGAERGWSETEVDERLGRRREVLAYLREADVTAYADVARVIQGYARDPERILEEVRSGDLDPDSVPDVEDD